MLWFWVFLGKSQKQTFLDILAKFVSKIKTKYKTNINEIITTNKMTKNQKRSKKHDFLVPH
jgi:hypothetical protein